MEVTELYPQDPEGDQGDPGESPLRWEEEGAHHGEESHDGVLVQQGLLAAKC